MKEGYKFLLKILGWIIMSTFYIGASFYILINLGNEEAKLFLCLLVWMIISGVLCLKIICNIWKELNDVEVGVGEQNA